MEISGNVIARFETVQVTEKFAKREFWLQTDGEYPETLKFQLVNAKCDLANDLVKGETIKVKFSITGKPYKSKTGEDVLYNNLNAYAIEKLGQSSHPNTHPNTQNTAKTQTTAPITPLPETSDTDDLPF